RRQIRASVGHYVRTGRSAVRLVGQLSADQGLKSLEPADETGVMLRMPVLTLTKTKRSAVAETVLFVDSDVLVRTAVAEYLRECGYQVVEALNAAEALKILRADAKVDALFSEIDLGGEVDGFSLAQKVRQEFPGIEIILASGPSLIAKKSGELC